MSTQNETSHVMAEKLDIGSLALDDDVKFGEKRNGVFLNGEDHVCTDGASSHPLSFEEREETVNSVVPSLTHTLTTSTSTNAQRSTTVSTSTTHPIQATTDEISIPLEEKLGATSILSGPLSPTVNFPPQQQQQRLQAVKTKKEKKEIYRVTDERSVINIHNACNVVKGDRNTINYYSPKQESKKKSKSKATSPILPSVKLPCEEVTSSHIEKVADKLGKTWKRLGRKLKLCDSDLEIIEHDNRSSGLVEICHQMLVKWKQIESEKATMDILGEALCQVNKHELAEQLLNTS